MRCGSETSITTTRRASSSSLVSLLPFRSTRLARSVSQSIDFYIFIIRVPTPAGKSWICFIENSKTWKLLENHFGPGKSWKFKLKVLESPGKISLKVVHFSSGTDGKQAAVV